MDRERVGLGGFCVGASFALVAAADAGIRDRVYFVNALGPYYDAETLLLQTASRTVVYDGESTQWEPDQLTTRVLTNELIETLENPRDADLLTRRYLYGNPGYPGGVRGAISGGTDDRATAGRGGTARGCGALRWIHFC